MLPLVTLLTNQLPVRADDLFDLLPPPPKGYKKGPPPSPYNPDALQICVRTIVRYTVWSTECKVQREDLVCAEGYLISRNQILSKELACEEAKKNQECVEGVIRGCDW
jgi:hypothetical protein